MFGLKRRSIVEPIRGHSASSPVIQTYPAEACAMPCVSQAGAELRPTQIPVSSPTFIRPGPSRAASSRSNHPHSAPSRSASKRLSASSSALVTLKTASSSFVSLLSFSRVSTPTRTTFDVSSGLDINSGQTTRSASPVSPAGLSNISISDHSFLSATTEYMQASPTFADDSSTRSSSHRAKTKQSAPSPNFARHGSSRVARVAPSPASIISLESPQSSGLFQRRKSTFSSASSPSSAKSSNGSIPAPVHMHPNPLGDTRPETSAYDYLPLSPISPTVHMPLEMLTEARERRPSASSSVVAGPSRGGRRRRASSVSSVSAGLKGHVQPTLPTSLNLVPRREPEPEHNLDGRGGGFFSGLAASKLRRSNSQRERRSRRFSTVPSPEDLLALPPPVEQQKIGFGASINVMDGDGRGAVDPMDILRRL